MANLDFSTIFYPTRLAWYNEERREVKTIIQTTCGYPSQSDERIEYNQQYYFPLDASYNNFILDASSYDSQTNYGYTPLFTLANGVVIGLEYYGTINGANVSISGRMGLYKNDGTLIRRYNNTFTAMSEFMTGWQNQSLDHFNILYYPPFYYYSGSRINEGDTPLYGVNYTGICIGYKNQTVYQPDPLTGAVDVFTGSNFDRTRMRYVGSANITFEDGWRTIYNELVDNGDGTIISPIQPSEDTSTQGGGDSANPDYNPFSEDVDFPTLPTISALSSGMISAYNPSNSMLTQLGQKLWSANIIEELKKIWNDPMEGIISLHLMPFTPPVYGSKECKIGSYNTEIVMPTIISQFVQKYCGTIRVAERFASALDYSPYTTAYIHIPFVGIVPLDIDYIMNKTLDLRYQIDVLTGNGVAMLRCDGAILYEFPCNLAMSIPLTSVNHGALYRNIIDVAGNAGHAVVAGATGSGASAVANGVVRTLESALNTVASKHSEVQKSGAITGGAGMLDVFEAYLIFHRPIQSLASEFNHFKGFPCNITYTLSELSGYTEVEYAHLEGVTATDEEKDEIQTLLQTGVIL